MKVFMVRYRNRGPGSKAVEADTQEEAMERFDAWRDQLMNKEVYSKAISAHELNILRKQ